MSYYSDEDEIDIHVRRGRVSPAFDVRPRPRPAYYTQNDRHLEIARGSYERSRSRGPVIRERQIIREMPYREREGRRERPVSPQPITINNVIENRQEYDDDEYYDDDRRHLPLAIPVRSRSRSRPRERDRERERERDPAFMTREDYELERTRKELERYKLQAQREEDEKLMKKELELKRLREEKRAEEEKKKKKEDEERAIREYKAKEAEKKEKERKEKEEREAEYKKRLEEDLRKSGIEDRQIAQILKKEKDDQANPNRPTYTRMARRYLSIETLNAFRIDYTLDTVRCRTLSSARNSNVFAGSRLCAHQAMGSRV
jgi:hypothetical protein